MLRKIKSALLSNKTTAQTVAKNTFWLFAGEFGGRVFRSAIVIYAARVLGTAGYGAFSYAMATAGLVTILSDIGISAILIRESVKFPELRKQYFSTALILKLILVIINVTVVIFLVPLFTTIAAAKILLPLIAFIIAFDTLREFGFGLLRSLEKMEKEAFIRVSMNMIIAGLGLFFLIRIATAKSLALAYALGTGAGFLMTVIILWPYFKNLFAGFEKSFVKKILVSAWPIGLLGLLGSITINTDMLMLGWSKSPEDLGLYAAAQKPVQFLYVVPTLLASAIFPVFARYAKNNPAGMRHVLERSAALTMLIALPIVFGGLILAQEIVLLLYGTEYVGATLSFQILLITLLINSPSIVLHNAILAYDKQLSFLKFFAVATISNVVFNILLIPPFGIAGAAIATIIAQLTGSILMWRAMKHINSFSIIGYLGKFVFASILMAGCTYLLHYLQVSFIMNLAISALFYFTLLVLIKEPLLKEARNLLRPRGDSVA